jgi:hypothetical protein
MGAHARPANRDDQRGLKLCILVQSDLQYEAHTTRRRELKKLAINMTLDLSHTALWQQCSDQSRGRPSSASCCALSASAAAFISSRMHRSGVLPTLRAAQRSSTGAPGLALLSEAAAAGSAWYVSPKLLGLAKFAWYACSSIAASSVRGTAPSRSPCTSNC